MAKFQSVLVHKNEIIKVVDTPKQLPVTLNFDKRNVVGNATMHFDEKGNLFADIEISDEAALQMMKPCISVCSMNYISKDALSSVEPDILKTFLDYKVDGISLCNENQDIGVVALNYYQPK